MASCGTIWDVAKCCWGFGEKHAVYICDLEKNLETLTSKWEELESISQDVKRKVKLAEDTGERRRTSQVKYWLKNVDAIQEVIKDIQDRGGQEMENKCLSNCCSKSCVSSYKLGMNVSETLHDVENLIKSGKDFASGQANIACKLPSEPVDKIPVVETVGLDSMLEEVWDSIRDDNIGVIGLHGMGGVGKTTLLKKINNEFTEKEHDFDRVLYVEVSEDCDTVRIMNDIRCQLGIDDQSWSQSDKRRKVTKICKFLEKKKFVLLLDDLWGELNLKELGIPVPGGTKRQSKVIFTTRSEALCDRMHAHKKFKVGCLNDEDAFDLFCMTVGREFPESHQNTGKLAREIASKCGGLPLALITVGSAMAGVDTVNEWNDAEANLQTSPLTASGLEEDVFPVLKFSYERLPDETLKKCFLYCAQFPKGYKINVPNLIYQWC